MIKEILLEVENTDSVSILDLKALNKNIQLYLKNLDKMSEKVKNTMMQTITNMMIDIAKKIPGKDKYERFITKLTDEDTQIDTLTKIIAYTNKLIKEKSNEKPQAENNRATT